MTARYRILVGRPNDLPITWDGRRVEWAEWQHIPVHICPPPPPEACGGCGSTTDQPIAVGTVSPADGETVDITVEKRLPSGRLYNRQRAVHAWPAAVLTATRCPDCLLDTVTDRRTGETWTLDETDYGPDGSTDPRLF